MQTAQLRHLAERAEGRASSEGVRDLVESTAAAIAAALKVS